jgi:hypothetical protein
MIETVETTAPEAETDPNFSAERTTTRINGKDKPGWRVTYGDPARTIVTADLSLGDQFNLMEIAGENASRNWMAMAGFAASVVTIDGVPAPSMTNKQQIARFLDDVTEPGFIAYLKALGTVQNPPAQREAETAAAAKNF